MAAWEAKATAESELTVAQREIERILSAPRHAGGDARERLCDAVFRKLNRPGWAFPIGDAARGEPLTYLGILRAPRSVNAVLRYEHLHG